VSGVPFKSLLFDVDGTLIDSNRAHAESWMEALREHGIKVDLDRVRSLIGMGGDKLLPAVAQVTEDSDLGKEIARRKKTLFGMCLPMLRPTRGARPLLEYLRDEGVELIIATSAADRELNALLRRAGVDDLFPERASKDDAAQSKPDPDIVHAALAKSRAWPAETAMIGDTPYDIEAANRAGIQAIALRCGGYWTDSDLRGAIAIFDDPQAVLDHWHQDQQADRQSGGIRHRAGV
jgi:HAD superfamily hydrolase (TIGR01509 family)